ncbi:unnamed protein product [Ambrosiozyma monospora]|uniref:Unnamed protein product n=1 Tax=Ambrosiozyma monospora TaxID=43982 RepID=A0A9W6WF55_AMBMO|nr:unnamed protein product [Ambrosiozyma monospora]
MYLGLMSRTTRDDNSITIILSKIPHTLKQFGFFIEKPEMKPGYQRNGRQGQKKKPMLVTYMFPMVYLPKFMNFDAYETMKSFVSTT